MNEKSKLARKRSCVVKLPFFHEALYGKQSDKYISDTLGRLRVAYTSGGTSLGGNIQFSPTGISYDILVQSRPATKSCQERKLVTSSGVKNQCSANRNLLVPGANCTR